MLPRFFFKKKSTGESECLCMDGKEVTCASAPPAKFRSAKGDDYAGEFFFTKPPLFIFFSKFTGNRKSAKKGKSGKNLRVREILQKRGETKISYFSI